MARSTLCNVLALHLAAACALAGCTGTPEPLPRAESATAEYELVRSQWLEPGYRLGGAARREHLRAALRGFASVISHHPEEAAAVVRGLCSLESGEAHLALGESARARESLVRCVELAPWARRLPHGNLTRAALEPVIDRALTIIRVLDGVRSPERKEPAS